MRLHTAIIGKKVKEAVYQLMDNYTLFYFQFITQNKNGDSHYWTSMYTAELQRMQNRVDTFIAESGTDKAVHLTLITSNGVSESSDTSAIHSLLTMDALFAV